MRERDEDREGCEKEDQGEEEEKEHGRRNERKKYPSSIVTINKKTISM